MFIMKRIKLWGVVLFSMVAYLAVSCAVEVDEKTEDIQERIFNAFIRTNGWENAERLGDSTYIVERSGTGTGTNPSDSMYGFVRYTAQYTTGDYAAYNYDSIAKQLGTYEESSIYEPFVWPIRTGDVSDPLCDILKNMKPGEKTLSVVAPWTNTTNSTYAFTSTSAPIVYSIELLKVVPDIQEYEYEQLQQFSNKYFEGMDSLSQGFYFKKIHASGYADTIADGNAIRVKYVGRLLNGRVFDTNIEDTAKKYDLYNPMEEYNSMSVVYNVDPETIEKEEDLVLGFCKALTSGGMTYGDKCFVFFVSDLGYGGNGNLENGSGIPPYCPISFEVWIEEYEKA